MTKEELKQEAEDKADNYLGSINYDHGNVSDTPFSTYDVFVAYEKGAMDFAEPREKRIAELERKLEQTEKDLADYQFNYPTIKELQKENAELKEQNETKDIQIKELQEQKCYWKESSFDWRHKFFKKDEVKRLVKKDKQLTKAKEHIQTLISCLIDWVQEGDKDYCHIADAKQFISEVEK